MLAKGRSSKIVRSESCRWEGQTSSFPLLGDPSGFLPGQDVTIASACAPPGGGRNPVTPRFIRHFSMLCLPMPSEHSLKQIFQVSVDVNVVKKGKHICSQTTMIKAVCPLSEQKPGKHGASGSWQACASPSSVPVVSQVVLGLQKGCQMQPLPLMKAVPWVLAL